MKTLFWFLVFAMFSNFAVSATRDFVVRWTQDCSTTEGDDLDLDDDGVCEGLTGFRIYDDAGGYITGLPEDGTRQHVFRYNVPWGEACFTMKSIMDDPVNAGEVLESDMSNRGGCIIVQPGRPVPPDVQP